MTPRVAIYARVSTTNHGQDVSMQTRELRQFAEARGWRVADEYIDAGVSGAKDSRPGLNRLMADAHKRRFDVVCVWRFDRFARSVSHLLRALENFKALGIALTRQLVFVGRLITIISELATIEPETLAICQRGASWGMRIIKMIRQRVALWKIRIAKGACDHRP
jgi:DNA invertase Pin-like site-specific DNA recombinase